MSISHLLRRSRHSRRQGTTSTWARRGLNTGPANITFRNQHACRRLRSLLSELRSGGGECADTRHADGVQQRDRPEERVQPDRPRSTSLPTGAIKHTRARGRGGRTPVHRQFPQSGFFNNTATSMLSRSNPDHLGSGDVPAECDRRRQSSQTTGGGLRAGPDRVVAQCSARRRRSFRPFDLTITTTATAIRSTGWTTSCRHASALSSSHRAAVALRQLQRVVSAELGRSVLVADDGHAAGEAGEVQQLRGGREVGRPAGPVPHDRGLSARPHQHPVDRPDDPTRIVQTGSQRTNGFELGVNGRICRVWTIAGGYAYQNAFVTSATTAARCRRSRSAQVPHHTLSLWNNVPVAPAPERRPRRI